MAFLPYATKLHGPALFVVDSKNPCTLLQQLNLHMDCNNKVAYIFGKNKCEGESTSSITCQHIVTTFMG